LISGPPAVFPQAARDRGISGVVDLEATVDKHGAVVNVVVVSGNALFVPYAKYAVLKRRYQPATLNGEPLEVKFPIKVVFDASSKTKSRTNGN
jgi:TonB family protein